MGIAKRPGRGKCHDRRSGSGRCRVRDRASREASPWNSSVGAECVSSDKCLARVLYRIEFRTLKTRNNLQFTGSRNASVHLLRNDERHVNFMNIRGNDPPGSLHVDLARRLKPKFIRYRFRNLRIGCSSVDKSGRYMKNAFPVWQRLPRKKAHLPGKTFAPVKLP